MGEREPFATINSGEQRIEAYPDNTHIYRHIGKFAVYDHVFINVTEDKGMYVWNDNPHFNDLATLAVQNDCQMSLNIREVSAVDVKSFIRHHTQDKDEIPDWLPEV